MTRHRASQLKRCLRSLWQAAAQSAGDVELSVRVLLDGNASDPETEATVAEFPQVAFSRSDTRLGPARARNFLLDRLGGEDCDWFFFVDDDAYVDKSFLGLFARIAREEPSAAVIGGPNLTPPASTAFQVATGAVLACRFGNYLSTSRYRPSGERRASGERELILCNLFVRKEWILRVRFPESYVCAEENRLMQQLDSLGARLVHEPALCVYHERRETPGQLAAQVFKYGRGRGQNLKDVPKSLRWPYMFPSIMLVTAVFLVVNGAIGDKASWAVLGALGASYALACLAMSARLAWSVVLPEERSRLAIFWDCVLIFPLLHFSYALGVLRGLAFE